MNEHTILALNVKEKFQEDSNPKIRNELQSTTDEIKTSRIIEYSFHH